MQILVADNFEILRQGLTRGLTDARPHLRVVQASSGAEAISICQAGTIDIVIMNLALKHPSGHQTLQQILKTAPDTKVLVQFEDDARLDGVRALSLGATGVIPLSAKISEYATAVETLASGYAFLPNTMISNLIGMRPASNGYGNVYGLTSREMDVAIFTARLRSISAVSEALGISKRTVETHRSAIYRKTGISKLSDLQMLVQDLVPASQDHNLSPHRMV